jgi:hypothetical protein
VSKGASKIVPRLRGGGVVLAASKLRRLVEADPQAEAPSSRKLRVVALPRRKAAAMRAK